ncbi:MAG: undecaprenyl-diphosphate phosphatase [Clostridia bacterium]|nr:MAG: undecaprenyl-diphosphate phosphatase [Clostridia bacterium]
MGSLTGWEAIILGFVQGLTEFLPVSSSGHLVLFQRLFGLQEAALLFDVVLHLATLVAVLVVFYREFAGILRRPASHLTWLLVAGTIPTGIIGLAFRDFFDRLFASGQSLGVEFIITGLVLWLAESQRPRYNPKTMERISLLDAAFIGTMQGLAILPAISRSGLTIAGSLFRGLDRETAARFSFILSAPAILGAGLVELRDLPAAASTSLPWFPALLGAVAAGVSGYLAIRFMIRLLSRSNMRVFSFYVWALGLLVLFDQLVTHRFFPPLW